MQVCVVEGRVAFVEWEQRMEGLGPRADVALRVAYGTPLGDGQPGEPGQHVRRVHFGEAFLEPAVAGETPACAAGRPRNRLVAAAVAAGETRTAQTAETDLVAGGGSKIRPLRVSPNEGTIVERLGEIPGREAVFTLREIGFSARHCCVRAAGGVVDTAAHCGETICASGILSAAADGAAI